MNTIHQVHLFPSGKIISVADQTPLRDVLTGTEIDFPCGGCGICGKCLVELLDGEMDLSDFQRAILEKKGLSSDRWRLACLSRVTQDISIMIPHREQAILSDEKKIDLELEEGYAVAVDLGTTTIVAQLISREEGRVVCTHSEINEQNRYGADIISRIAYALQGEKYREELTVMVRRQLGRMIEIMGTASGIDRLSKIVLVGNSAMHHFFSGLDVRPLSAYPFHSPNNGIQRFHTAELGWIGACEVEFLPNVSHFVGSDVLAGIYDLGIADGERWTALIDLGTNGELVIGNHSRVMCTSTAAGPAFEGVNITDGMRAVSGAICQVDDVTGIPRVIGGSDAAGICGSGLIDAIFYFLKKGRILPDGQLGHGLTQPLALSKHVAVYEKDIREFQLAKAAISTGWELLMRSMGLELEDIETIYVGGGMGNYLNLNHAIGLGLLKSGRSGQLQKAGNTALSGCRKMTFDASIGKVERILEKCDHFCLETDPDFQDTYCNNLFFG